MEFLAALATLILLIMYWESIFFILFFGAIFLLLWKSYDANGIFKNLIDYIKDEWDNA